ncbi:MAG: hypothetical protein OXG67_01590 [bacterium]|nr:hypothetical protein [bacterium]
MADVDGISPACIVADLVASICSEASRLDQPGVADVGSISPAWPMWVRSARRGRCGFDQPRIYRV